MLKLSPLFLIIAAFVFSGCPYNANVPLATDDTVIFDTRILGHWKSPYLTAEINGIRVAKGDKGQLYANEFSIEKGVIKYDKDTLVFTPTKVSDLFFLDQKSDTSNQWTAHPYFFSLNGNVLSTYSLNDTIIGKERKFASTAEYRDYVAHTIYRPGFMENPDVMMRVTDGELKGNYVDLMVTDTQIMHIDRMAYAVRTNETLNGKGAQKRIKKAERRIKKHMAGIHADSLLVVEDRGIHIKQFYFTALNAGNLALQKKALQRVKNIAIEPILQHFEESTAEISPLLDAGMSEMAGQMAQGEFSTIKKVEPVVVLDPFDEQAEALRERSLEHAMKIGAYLMTPYETIYDLNNFTFEGKDQKYWKVAIYRVWLK